MDLGPTLLITQARTGSTRLPNKVLLKIGEDELLKIHLTRLSNSKEIDKIIVATTTLLGDEKIVELCDRLGYASFRGSERDVLDRYYKAAQNEKPAWVVRVTSDCPLIDPELIDAVIKFAKVNDIDYASNVLVERFPDGQDVEVFKFKALQNAWQFAKLKSEREHVTPYIRSNSTFNGGKLFTALNFPCYANFSKIRMTVDEQKDYDLITRLVDNLGIYASWRTYANYIIDEDLGEMNGDIIRNEGFMKSLSDD